METKSTAENAFYRRIEQGKRVRYEPVHIPSGKPITLPKTDDEKTMMLHTALASFETVRDSEPPGTFRRRKMDEAIDVILEQIDCYRIEAWPPHKVSKAGDMVDKFNAMIAITFGSSGGPAPG